MKRFIIIAFCMLMALPLFAELWITNVEPNQITVNWDKIGTVKASDYVIHYNAEDKKTDWFVKEASGVISYDLKSLEPWTSYVVYVNPIIGGLETPAQGTNAVTITTKSNEFNYMWQGRDQFGVVSLIQNYAFIYDTSSFPSDVTKFVVTEDIYILSLNLTDHEDGSGAYSMATILIDNVAVDYLTVPKFSMAPMLYTGYLPVKKGQEFQVRLDTGNNGERGFRMRFITPTLK